MLVPRQSNWVPLGNLLPNFNRKWTSVAAMMSLKDHETRDSEPQDQGGVHYQISH